MTLRNRYDDAIQVANGFRMQGSAGERDGKLFANAQVLKIPATSLVT